MIINGKDYSVDDLVKQLDIEKNFLVKRKNGLMLTDQWIEILKRNNIDYLKYNNIKELIFEISNALEDTLDEQLEKLLMDLSEIDYYYYTNK